MSSSNSGSAPGMAAPSMAQQRIVLVALLVVISALAWWQNAGKSAHHAVQKFSKAPMPDAVAEMDFTYAEAVWSGLRTDPQGNLLIDAQTESALSETLALLQNHGHDQAFEPQMARVALLLEKQLGAATSQDFMQLLPLFRNYKAIEQRWMEENGDVYPPRYAELFQLQDELLGVPLAEKLFSGQRRMAELMLASHEISNDPSLTQEEKEQALMDLQDALREEGAH